MPEAGEARASVRGAALNITEFGKATSLQLVLWAQPIKHLVILGARPQSPGTSYVDTYCIPGQLPAPAGGGCDITGLYLAKFKLLPPNKRIPIQVMHQIKGWRDLAKTLFACTPAQ